MNRREFLRIAAGAAGAGLFGTWPQRGWAQETGGEVAHVLPTVSHSRFWIKLSFPTPRTEPPWLRVDGRPVRALPTDTRGRFWAFDVRGLRPARRYTLELSSGGRLLVDPWELATFPHPDARPERFRVLAYTCAGGDDFFSIYVPMEARRRLLQRGLDFAPDAVLALGDHVYWDRVGGGLAFFTRIALDFFGFGEGFDASAPVLGHDNEELLSFVGDRQIAALYGTEFRSVPVFFARDDHDYFEDDREEQFLFPADAFMLALARATQRLYYPELLPDPTRPRLSGDAGRGRPGRLAEAFGTLRYGRLVEMLLYDCKGFLAPAGVAGGLVPRDVERWLLRRMARSDAEHVVNVPSNPVGWSAGKPAEWYPDVVEGGALGLARPKVGWQPGVLAQHDRLRRAATQRRGVPLFVSGDIHSVAEQRILRSGAVDLSENPAVSLIAGTPGTGVRGWPSAVRGVLASRPAAVEGETVVPVTERNGFHLLDFEPGSITVRHFVWSPGDGDPAQLEPFAVSRYEAPPLRACERIARRSPDRAIGVGTWSQTGHWPGGRWLCIGPRSGEPAGYPSCGGLHRRSL